MLERLGGESFREVDPSEFFSLNGVAVEDDVMQFPGREIFACPKNDLLLLRSCPPNLEWYKFLNLVLDISEHFHARELYVVGGMISSTAHTAPRRIMGNCNSIETKDALSGYGIINETTFQTPSGQKPTLNSFLLWACQKRKIPAASLWFRFLSIL